MDFERWLKEEADVYFGDFLEAGRWSAMWCKASHERRRRLRIDRTRLAASVEEKKIKRVLVLGLKFLFCFVFLVVFCLQRIEMVR